MPAQPAFRSLPRVVTILVLVMAGIEAIFQIDALIGRGMLRGEVFRLAAFWPQLMHGAAPLFPAQGWTMLLSYAFLHGGLGHLAGNAVMLLYLGQSVATRHGTGGFLILFVISATGGALAFGLLNTASLPMVGASGAVFGLIGAVLHGHVRNLRSTGQSLRPILNAILWVVGLNVAFWLVLDGLLAWETHLGGFVAGWLGAMVLTGRRSSGS